MFVFTGDGRQSATRYTKRRGLCLRCQSKSVKNKPSLIILPVSIVQVTLLYKRSFFNKLFDKFIFRIASRVPSFKFSIKEIFISKKVQTTQGNVTSSSVHTSTKEVQGSLLLLGPPYVGGTGRRGSRTKGTRPRSPSGGRGGAP